jgi:hypothetical protein
VPYYLKIDIEGCDVFCLEALKRTQARPKYVSVETDGYDQLFHLYLLGYNKFKVINQALHKQAVPLQGHREKDSMSMQLSTGTAAVCSVKRPQDRGWRSMTP